MLGALQGHDRSRTRHYARMTVLLCSGCSRGSCNVRVIRFADMLSGMAKCCNPYTTQCCLVLLVMFETTGYPYYANVFVLMACSFLFVTHFAFSDFSKVKGVKNA